MERAGKSISINKIASILQISPDTSKRYLEYFSNTYLIYLMSRHGKTNERLLSAKKVYAPDLGIRTSFTGIRDKGSLFENYVFLNIKGREKSGTICEDNYMKELEKLRKKLLNVTDIHGRKMNNIVFQPEKYYHNPTGEYPDLMVIFDDLYWRAAGTIGHNTLHLLENDTGSDDAMHDWNGLYILYDPKGEITPGQMDAKIEDIAPTILYLLNEELPNNLEGKVIKHVKRT